MSNFENLNLTNFIKNLIEKTNLEEIKWTRLKNEYKHMLIDRSVNYSSIIDPFYTTNKRGENIVIGKLEKKVYYAEDEYYYDDIYFLSFTNQKFLEPTTFSNGAEVDLSFQIELGKLHRIVQINASNIQEKLNNWFD